VILYRPLEGDVHTTKVNYRPRTCFIMTQLGEPIPDDIKKIRSDLSVILKKRNLGEIDAESQVTGKDFLMKIWNMIITVSLGIAIINENMSSQTLSNIFYEIGLMQSYGKETLVIKTQSSEIPSDFVRTEYIQYDNKFKKKMRKFLDSFFDLPEYYENIADHLENNPLLSIDYLRRAYLISGEEEYRSKAKSILDNAGLHGRAKNSVEMLLANF
jgi:hypothetical protein